MLMLGQQFCGINAVMFYCVTIFQDSGSSLDPNVANIIVGGVMIVATVIAALVMDKAGRRLLLNISAAVMVVSIGALGAYFYIADTLGDTALATRIEMVPVASLSLFVFSFSIGFGPIPWLMMSELFAPEVKSLASSISASFNWTLAFICTKFFTNLVDLITEAGAFWAFGGFSVLTLIFCILFVPETKGKSLDDIQHLFRSPHPYFLDVGVWKLMGCGEQGGTEADTAPILEEQTEDN